MKKIFYLFALYYLLTGFYIFFAPMQFYTNTPGVALMGPYNFHFIRDIAFVFMASSGAMLWGIKHGIKSTAVAGAAWPFLHSLFHLQVWGMRDFALDFITAADFSAVIIPGFIVLYLAVKHVGESK